MSLRMMLRLASVSYQRETNPWTVLALHQRSSCGQQTDATDKCPEHSLNMRRPRPYAPQSQPDPFTSGGRDDIHQQAYTEKPLLATDSLRGMSRRERGQRPEGTFAGQQGGAGIEQGFHQSGMQQGQRRSYQPQGIFDERGIENFNGPPRHPVEALLCDGPKHDVPRPTGEKAKMCDLHAIPMILTRSKGGCRCIGSYRPAALPQLHLRLFARLPCAPLACVTLASDMQGQDVLRCPAESADTLTFPHDYLSYSAHIPMPCTYVLHSAQELAGGM